MKSLRLLLLMAFALLGGLAHAQETVRESNGVRPTSVVVATQTEALDDIANQVNAAESDINADRPSDQKLASVRADLEVLQDAILRAGVAFKPRLAEINSGLEQLGPAPKEGDPPESQANADRRAALNDEKQQINEALGKAEDLQIRVSALINTVAIKRRGLFSQELLKRYDLSATINPQVVEALDQQGAKLSRDVASWFRWTWQNKRQALLTATLIALLAGLVANFAGRRLFGWALAKDPDAHPGYLHRLGVAFWSTVLPSVSYVIFGVLVLGLYQAYEVLRPDIEDYLFALITVSFAAFFVNRLTNAALSPASPAWGLTNIEPRPARALIWLATLAATAVGLDGVVGQVSDRLSAPLSVTILYSLVAAIIVGVLLVVIARIKPFRNGDGEASRWPRWFRLLLYLLAAFITLAALAGYVSLAQFVSRQVVMTGAWLATAYIGLAASRAMSQEGGFADTWLGRWIGQRLHLKETQLDQLGVLTSVVVNLLIVLTLLPYLLFQWGYQTGDIAVWMNRLGTGFQIGGFTFSPLAILTGLAVFTVGYFVTKWFQGWLDGTVMARGRVDAGVRNSISLIVGYSGLALAALVAVSAAGLNLSNLALVAGGLSLGIGFGLQNVVSNFVSGLILLVERPFKAGDWIVAGDVSGTVKKISVRATEIETFQRQTVIMPNSVLINGAVRNWTHRNRIGRIDIPINVVYESDPARAAAVLAEVARNHPLVLKNPEPFAYLAGFSDAAMNFELRLFLGDVGNGSTVQNEIRIAVLAAFRKEGIVLSHKPYEGKLPEPPAAEEPVEADQPAQADVGAPEGRKTRKPRPDPG